MSLEKLEKLKGFLNTSYGSIWHKVNLHVHASAQKPDELLEAAIKAGITLIAITDHNNFNFVKSVQEAATRKTDSNLVVLPGIEITLEEGAHILAIFDVDFSEEKQTLLLGSLGLPKDGSSRNAVRDRNCSDVLRVITDAGGITVVPHPFSGDIGFLDKARKIPTKIDWLESGNIGLIQIAAEKVKYIDYDENGKWQNRFILASTPSKSIFSTDYSLAPIPLGEVKKSSEIENGAVWLKLGSKNVRGLRQVTCEPRTRVLCNKPVDCKKTKLLGLVVKGGYFDGLEIGFSSDFTCIFGENHTGKTAIFDFISFALGRDLSVLSVKREDELNLLLRRLLAILQEDSEVHLYIKNNDQIYCISRKFIPKYNSKTSEIVGIQDEPEILRFISSNDELIPCSSEEAIFYPEIYAQGHVGVLRRSVQSQLSLIDELAGLSELRKRREELKEALERNASALSEFYEEREALTGVVGGLPELEKDLEENSKHLKETDNQLWEDTKMLVENINSKIADLEGGVTKVLLDKSFLMPTLKYEKDKVVLSEFLDSMPKIIDDYNKPINSAISQIIDAFNTLKTAYIPLKKKWEEEYNTHKSKVSKILRKKGFESPEQLLTKIKTLKEQIEDINKIRFPQLKTAEKQIKTLKDKRIELLTEYKANCTKISRNRQEKIDELNRLIGPDMKINLEASAHEDYFSLMKEVCSEIASKAHKIQGRDEQLSLLISKVSPSKLAEAIFNNGEFKKDDGNITTLIDESGITKNTQQVLCTLSGAIKSLHKIEVFELEPTPKISVKREGTDVFADLSTELSPGEQSSAILTLALMARDVPLIIDQPEDELGYSYIVNKIIPKILDSKKERQVLLISHNANIPVLADAEYLVKIRNDPVESKSKCTIEQSGTFADGDICNKILELEGGKRAFQIRQYRYAIPRRIGVE